MPEDIATALQQGTGAAPAPVSDPQGTDSAAAIGAGSQPAAQPDADDLPGSIKEYLAQHPEHKDVADLITRETRSAWTPKLQEAADLRKKYEGLDDESIQSLRQLRQMAQTDPAGAAEWLRKYADQIHAPQQTQQQSQGQPQEFVPVTESEAALYRRIQDLEGRLEKTASGFESLSLHQQAVQVGDQFNKVQSELGIEIPPDVRLQCFEQSRAIGSAISPVELYFARNRDAIIARAAQKARDEAASVVQDKQNGAAGNPAGVTQRQGEGTSEEPQDLATILRRNLEARNIR